jgi:hypothetical protein
LSALRRVGVSFTEQQKEQIKTLDFLGKKQEAQAIILKALNEQVGGTGVNAAKGLAGALDTLNEEFTLFIENNTLTKVALSIVTGLLKGLNALFGEFEGTLRGLNLKELEEELAGVNQEIDKQSKLLENLQGDIDSSFVSNQNLIDLETKRQTILNAINKETEDQAKKQKALNDAKEEASKKDILLEDLAEKENLSNKREIEDLGKTEEELRVLNEARKIEDALLSKKIKDQRVMMMQ